MGGNEIKAVLMCACLYLHVWRPHVCLCLPLSVYDIVAGSPTMQDTAPNFLQGGDGNDIQCSYVISFPGFICYLFLGISNIGLARIRPESDP